MSKRECSTREPVVLDFTAYQPVHPPGLPIRSCLRSRNASVEYPVPTFRRGNDIEAGGPSLHCRAYSAARGMTPASLQRERVAADEDRSLKLKTHNGGRTQGCSAAAKSTSRLVTIKNVGDRWSICRRCRSSKVCLTSRRYRPGLGKRWPQPEKGEANLR